jgi:phage terminase large subunit-like protein
MTNFDNSKIYNKYCSDVLDGEIVAGEWMIKACQRYRDWFDREDLYFNYEDVDRKIRVIQRFKLQEGGYFILQPFQQFIIAGIFGFYYVDEPDIRVISNVLILTARKSGKSTFASALALVHILTDKQPSPEVAFIANTAKQAGNLFKYCKRLASSVDPKQKIFKRYRHDIIVPKLDAQINVLSSDTAHIDGRSDSLFIEDETHEARSFEIWNVLKTGQGARKNPLAISISTAGFNLGEMYPLYSQWKYCTNILDGAIEDDTWFSAIYQIDSSDDWHDEKVWVKANPGLGITPNIKYMRDQARTAMQSPYNETSIKTKNFNLWCQAETTWIKDDDIRAVMQPVNLEDYKDEIAYGGVDLSATNDLTSFAVLMPPNEDRELNPDMYIFKVYTYIPQIALEESANRDQYNIFVKKKHAFLTAGNTVDYEYILNDQLKTAEIVSYEKIAYDRYNARQWAIESEKEGLPLEPYGQSLMYFNIPTKYLFQLIISKKCIIDLNIVTQWAFQNVEIVEDHNENIKPMKAQRDKAKKIDPVIAIIESLGIYLSENDNLVGAFNI